MGFELNREKKFCLKFKKEKQYDFDEGEDAEDKDRVNEPGNIIGDYYLTFNKRSEYIYKTQTDCFGFSVRKK